MKNFLEKDKTLGVDLIVGLLKYWPITCPAKEVVYINELEEIMDYIDDNDLSFINDDSNKDIKFDRNFIRHKIFPLLEDRWKEFPARVNSLSRISKERNKNYKNLVYEKFDNLIGNEINLKELKKIPKSLAYDVIRYSIKECNIAIPNSKIMQEIYKTFVDSNPGPKSLVTWSNLMEKILLA